MPKTTQIGFDLLFLLAMNGLVALVRRLYDWTLAWGERPGGVWALGALSAAESVFFPLPPDPLLIGLCLGHRRRSLFFGLWCTFASVMGAALGYWLGATAWEQLSPLFFEYMPGFTPERFKEIEAYYTESGVAVVLLAGFTPIPYKLFTLTSGAMGLSFPAFMAASVVGRGSRFMLVAAAVYFFGEPVKAWLDKNFDRVVWLVAALIIIGFALWKVMS